MPPAPATSPTSAARRVDPLRAARARRRAQLAGWLTAPIGLAAVVSGVALIRNGPPEIPLIAIAACGGLILVWLLVSIFFPAHLDRSCPRCDEESLGPLDPVSFQGVRCTSCGYEDPERSGYLMAAADGQVKAVPTEDARS